METYDAIDQQACDDTSCRSCGSSAAPVWSTPDGPAHLCPPCATLHGVGCP
jgi:hypothetical protein